MRRFKTQLNLVRAALMLLIALLTTGTAWAAAELRTFTFEYNSSNQKSYICCNGSKALLGNGTWLTGTATLGDITTTITFDQNLESCIVPMTSLMQNICGYSYCIGGNYNSFNLTMTSTNKYIVHAILYNVHAISFGTVFENTSVATDNRSKTFSYYWNPDPSAGWKFIYKIDLVLNDNNQPAYKIDYELNEGTNASSNPAVYEKSTGVASFANPTKSGYTFDGWYLNADFTGDRVTSIAAGTTGDVKLYAKWRIINYYHITFSPGAYGTGTMPTDDVPIGDSYTLPECGFTASGYHFTGWLVGDNTTQQSPGTPITVNSDLVITAAWAGNKYTIHYDANGGSGSIANQSFTYPTAQNLAFNSFTKPGYKFSKWNTKADGTGTSYNEGQSVNLVTQHNETITLYAQWVIDDAGFSNQGDTYYIKNLDGWNVFCDLIASGTNLFENKTVVLQNSIGTSSKPVSRMAGDNNHRFKGTFNGNNKTLTVNYTPSSNCAPFLCTENATFQNLTVAGTITTSAKYAAGLIGQAYGTTNITNCRSSITISTSVNGDGTHGGFIASTANGSTTNFTNCIFDGSIVSTGGNTTTSCGGYVGWSPNTVTITDCLFAPASITIGTNDCYTFVRRGSATTVENSYYYTALGTAQGTQGYATRQSFPCRSVTILGTTVYYAAELALFGKTDSYTPDGSAEHPFIISNADGWDYFCDCLQDNDTWNRFSGKTVKLGADISVTRMAGSASHDFCGTFDGNHKTITFNYGSEAEPESGISALFSHTSSTKPFGVDTISPATIKDLTVGGTIWTSSNEAAGFVGRVFETLNLTGCTSNIAINSSADFPAGFINYSAGTSTVNISGCTSNATINTTASYAAGLVGHLYGSVNIEHCISNAEITAASGAGGFVGLCEHAVGFNDCLSSAIIHSADGNNSGFVGWSRSSGYLISFEGCAFNGKLLQQNGSGHSNGGFVGWKGDGKTVTITNCLVDPAALAQGETMATDGTATFSREHTAYAAIITNSYFTDTLGVVQGKQAHSITAGEGVTVEMANSAIQYGTSGITAYGTGIMYNGVLYAGINDEVSLNLDGSANGYSVNAGTLTGEGNPFTLLMPDENVTISAAAQFQRGDVNQDGNITIADVTTLIDYLLSNDSAIPAEADVNADGSVSIADVTALIDYLLSGTI